MPGGAIGVQSRPGASQHLLVHLVASSSFAGDTEAAQLNLAPWRHAGGAARGFQSAVAWEHHPTIVCRTAHPVITGAAISGLESSAFHCTKLRQQPASGYETNIHRTDNRDSRCARQGTG